MTYISIQISGSLQGQGGGHGRSGLMRTVEAPDGAARAERRSGVSPPRRRLERASICFPPPAKITRNYHESRSAPPIQFPSEQAFHVKKTH